MPDHSEAIGTYFLPVIPSMEGVDANVNKGMAKLLGRFGDIGKKAGTDLGKGIGDGLKAAQAEVDNATKSYEKLRDKAADALDKIGVEEKKLAKARAGGKEDMIAAAEARLAKARRDSTRASKESEASHSHLLGLQNKLSSSTGDLGGKLGALGGVTARLGPAMAALGAAAAGAAVAGIALLAAGAVTATRELYQLGEQWDDISDNLRIKTGATGGALDGLADSVKRIGSSVPLGLGQLGDIVADTNTALRLTGPELEAVSAAIADLGRMTGENIDIRQLGKAFRAFGVDAADQVPALNSLFNAGKNLGIGANELIGNLLKGGPALRQLGLGFGESAALASQFEEAGLDGTKMMASLAKAMAVMAENGQTGGASFQQLIGRVKELLAAGKETVALDMTNKMFGKKAGAEFFEAIKNGALDLDALTSSMTLQGETIAEAAEGTADWSERWQLLKNEAVSALEPLGATVFDFVNEKLGAMADWVSTHHDEIVDAFVAIGQAIVTAGQVGLRSLGQMVQGLGEILIPIGDVVGAIRKSDAWLAEMSGDTEKAAMYREQSEAAYSWGEGLQDAGRKMAEFADQGDKLKDELGKLGEQAKTSATDTSKFGETAKSAGGDARSATGDVTGLFDAMNQPLIGGGFAGQFNDALGNTPGLLGGAAGALPGMGVPPSGGPLIGGGGGAQGGVYGLPAGTDTGGYGSSGAVFPAWVHQLENTFGVKASTYSGHQEDNRSESGYAPNPMGQNRGIDWSGPVDAMQRFADYLAQVPGALEQVIWQNPNTGRSTEIAGGRFQPGYFAGDLAGHRNHVHTRQSSPIPVPGMANTWYGAAASGASVAPSVPPAVVALGSTPTAALPSAGTPVLLPAPSTSPIDFGANDVSRQMTNAFGPGYLPGFGTPGFDEEGNPGYYRTDPRSLAQAQRRVEDSQRAISDADQRILDAKARQAELEDDILASAEDRAKAAQEVSRAEQAAKRAREDALWAQEDAAETAKGRFTAAKKDTKTKDKKGGGGSELDGLGGILGGFLKETFGLDGSLFPDISNLMPVQMAGAALGAFKGPLQGALEGKLGIQQPGWTPEAGDPFAGAADAGSSTSGLPFGMIPGISSVLPDMAEPGGPLGAHNGSGAAPGPVDSSTNITINNPVGDENSIAAQTRRTLMRTPRMNTYTPPATMGGG